MYLKRLEIHGFKSFADKVSLDFRQGLSVVVGPNGSGKSNISDAIRWVIGEQSAKSLRGSKMEDIIFAGSDKRRQVGMAEVSLTLDNTSGIFPLEFSEITVTRRVFRSGESEYLINKSQCRLKDVQELFMDTGIGRESFSIIGQGRVEEILSSKPEDRRGIIEDVAGVTKYRNRKKEAARKLESTENNLIRLADIIAELENQLAPLAEQAEKAGRFLEIKQQLDKLELDLIINDLRELQAKLQDARCNIRELKDTILISSTALSVLESGAAELKLLLQGLDERLYQGQTKCHELSVNIQQAESDLKLCNERLGGVDDQQKKAELEKIELGRKLADLQAEHQDEESRLILLSETRKELEFEQTTRKQLLHEHSKDLGSAEGAIEELKTEIFEILAQTAKFNNDITAFKHQEESRQQRRNSLRGDIEGREVELSETNSKLETVLSEMGAAREQTNNQVFEQKRNQHDTEQTTTLIQSLEVEIATYSNSFQATTSRLQALKDMQREHEGYARGVKEVLRGADQGSLEGVCGVLADLIQIPDKLETALEVALGANFQNIITDNEQAAKQAVAYLKNNRFGRATFLPMDTLQPKERNFSPKVLQAKGVLGVAADLVGFDPMLAKAFEYMLGRILVVENLELATEAARIGQYKLRIVTLDGDFLSPGGSITGGSMQHRGNSILGRSGEIARLEQEAKKWSEAIEALEGRKAEAEVVYLKLQTAGKELEKQLKELELSLSSKETLRMALQRELARQQREVEDALEEDSQIAQDLQLLAERKLLAVRARDESQHEYEMLTEKISAEQENIKDKGSIREQIMESITEVQIRLAGLEQEEIGLNTALERYFRQKADLTSGLVVKETEIFDLESRKTAIDAEVLALRQLMGELAVSEHNAQADLIALREERFIKQTVLSENEQQQKNLRHQLAEKQEILHGDEVREARFETEIANGLSRLEVDLEIDFEQAEQLAEPMPNRRETVININKFKAEVGRIGPVNVGAIEEYARVGERFEFLSRQQADLIGAKLALFDVIKEMDRIMVQRFDAAFALIKANFSKVFEELFGGGRAELLLSDPNNLLETGVEIVAQPPGKKLQHLSLLSGGEKALTAIALLFAMLKVRPSPFCVLDEIEAALDEANVTRFAGYLKELTALNQFIVVSHRKGTMEVADVLYGVTMEETGVSKLYSVKMAADELAG